MTDWKISADYTYPGIRWHECKTCQSGTIEFINSIWDCSRCLERRVFGSHLCPKLHNHPVVGAAEEPSKIDWNL